jgi:hypothetical protein
MLNDHTDIALSLAGLQRVENIGIATQVVLNKAPGFCVQSACRTYAARAADEYPENRAGFAVAQKAFKQAVAGSSVDVFSWLPCLAEQSGGMLPPLAVGQDFRCGL